ncbi:MAG: YidC/Oxa1 family membrane protein insertase [Clostridia bacterium]|nr:YidC/Oxa1 family membrane protein insertase [Clostridia bacterium]MBQ2347147.1 YidC/Oxa1 family membrane protein insertase [Clostridia bacterium]
MNQLFNIIGYLFGYLLWGAFSVVKNFAIAILIFTIILRIIQFPMQIKSQKNMAGNMRMQSKQKELQEKYGKDKARLNEELSKLYEKENINPMGGCVTSIVPMFLLMGVYWTIRNPLTNTLHISADSVDQAMAYLKSLPVIGAAVNDYYGQINLIGYFSAIKDNLDCFTDADITKIETFAEGFKLFGMNLLDAPNTHGIFSLYILFPVLCFVTSFGTSFVTMRMNGASLKGQQGCMNSMFLMMPIMSAWIAYTVPSAMGLYWIYSSIIGFISTIILHKFYNAESMTALDEARRIALLEAEEAEIKAVIKKSVSVDKPIKKKKKK